MTSPTPPPPEEDPQWWLGSADHTTLDVRIAPVDTTQLDAPTARPTGPLPAAPREIAAALAQLAERFEIDQEPLASGVQARLYRATRATDGQSVLLRLDRSPGGDYAPLRLTELRCRSLVEVLEVGTAQALAYQVLRPAPGIPLDDYLARRGPLRSLEVTRLVEQVLEALVELQRLHLVHQDLSAHNLLVHARDGHFDVTVVDLGLASRLDHTTVPGVAGGNPMYAPPEYHLAQPVTSQRWDYWSLGMVVALAATGHHPLEGTGDNPGLATTAGMLDPVGLDERTAVLVGGLLQPLQHRWGAEEVRSWLRGEEHPADRDEASPHPGTTTTPSLTPVPTFDAERRARQHFHFAGYDFHHDRLRLADALGMHWDEACELLGSPGRLEELGTFARQFDLRDLDAALELAGNPGVDLDFALVAVIGALQRGPRHDQAAWPWFLGLQLTPRALGDSLGRALLATAQLDTDGRSMRVAGEVDPDLHRSLRLLDGGLDALAATPSPGNSLARLQRDLEQFRHRLAHQALRCNPPLQPAERTVMELECLAGGTSLLAASTLRRRASLAAQTQPALRSRLGVLADPSTALLVGLEAQRGTSHGGRRSRRRQVPLSEPSGEDLERP